MPFFWQKEDLITPGHPLNRINRCNIRGFSSTVDKIPSYRSILSSSVLAILSEESKKKQVLQDQRQKNGLSGRSGKEITPLSFLHASSFSQQSRHLCGACFLWISSATSRLCHLSGAFTCCHLLFTTSVAQWVGKKVSPLSLISVNYIMLLSLIVQEL